MHSIGCCSIFRGRRTGEPPQTRRRLHVHTRSTQAPGGGRTLFPLPRSRRVSVHALHEFAKEGHGHHEGLRVLWKVRARIAGLPTRNVRPSRTTNSICRTNTASRRRRLPSPSAAPQLPSIASTIVSQPPVVRRGSRETLRLPSPKPAPSVHLPEPPASAPATMTVAPKPRKHRPADLVITLSACLMEAGPSSTTPLPFSPQHRPSRSAPSVMSPTATSPDEDSSYLVFSPTSPSGVQNAFQFPSPPSSARADQPTYPPPSRSPLKATPSTRSTATINTRNRNRSEALAALEGRGPRSLSAVREDDDSPSRPRNFMSMSDDEDEDEVDDVAEEQVDLLSVLNEEEGLVMPPPCSPASVKRGRTPTPAGHARRDSKSSGTHSSKRSRSTVESFLAPLTNFIDFREDESSRGWRSFIEVSS